MRDRFLLWLARRCLAFMSNRAAWQLHRAMTEAYRQRPDLAEDTVT